MALLNPPQILPNVALVIYRVLQTFDEAGMSAEDLSRAVAPAALTRTEANEGPGSRGFDQTLSACVLIGLLQRHDDLIRLHPDVPRPAGDRRTRDAAFPSLLLNLIMEPRLNDGLWDSSEGARDLTRALAWYLGQDALAPPAGWNEENGVHLAQERQFAGPDRIFSNDTRWGSFDRWAAFLGLASRLPRSGRTVLLPDPTPALRSIVPELLAPGRQPVLEFLDALATRLPVLDRGVYRAAVEERMRPDAVLSGDDLLSPALAHALLRLRDEKLLVIEDLADAPTKVRMPEGFSAEKTLSHLVPTTAPASGKGSKRKSTKP